MPDATITLHRRGKPPVSGTMDEIAPVLTEAIAEKLGGGGKARRKRSDEVIARAGERQAREPELLASAAVDAVQAAGIAADRLRSLVERIERLEEEKAAIAGDIREVFAEAKGAGFDTKIMRQVIKLRRLESDDRQEQETLLDLYKQALGMLS